MPSVSVLEVEFAYPQLLGHAKISPRGLGAGEGLSKIVGEVGDLPPRQSANVPSPQIVPIFFWRRNFAAFHQPMLEIATK